MHIVSNHGTPNDKDKDTQTVSDNFQSRCYTSVKEDAQESRHIFNRWCEERKAANIYFIYRYILYIRLLYLYTINLKNIFCDYAIIGTHLFLKFSLHAVLHNIIAIQQQIKKIIEKNIHWRFY